MFQKNSPKNRSVHILPQARDRISPYNINTILSRQVMRMKKNIDKGIINWSSWSNTKFSELTSQEFMADSKENY